MYFDIQNNILEPRRIERRDVNRSLSPGGHFRHKLSGHGGADQTTVAMTECKNDSFVARTKINHGSRIRKAGTVTHPFGTFSLFQIRIHHFAKF